MMSSRMQELCAELQEAVEVERQLRKVRGQFVRHHELAKAARDRYTKDNPLWRVELSHVTADGHTINVPCWMTCRQFLDTVEKQLLYAVERQRSIARAIAGRDPEGG